MPRDPFIDQSQDLGGPQMPSLKTGQFLFNRRYELVRVLGAGGMGVVWLARDHTEEIDVALKFLPSVLVLQESEMRRLKEEVRTGKELRHPGIVATYALELEDATAAIVMEYVPGQTLKELLEANERGFFEPEEITSWLRGIAEAIDYLHTKAKRVHRDLKPANVIVNGSGEARLMDFGISRRIEEGVTRHSKTSDGYGASSATLAYASPQQLAGKPAAPADDIYSLGALLYELLTGSPPFFRGDAALVAVQIATQPVTRLMERRAELVSEGLNAGTGRVVSDAVERSVLACLAKEREQRPAGAKAVSAALAAPSRPPMPVRIAPQPRPPAKPSPGTRRPPDASRTSRASSAPVPLRGLSGPLLAAAALAIVSAGAWMFFFKPKANIKEAPKLVVDTAAREEAARQKQRADELEQKAKDEEQKRLAAEAATAKAKADAHTEKEWEERVSDAIRQGKLALTEARYHNALTAFADALVLDPGNVVAKAGFSNADKVDQAAKALAKLRGELEEKGKIFKPQHPVMREIDDKIAESDKLLNEAKKQAAAWASQGAGNDAGAAKANTPEDATKDATSSKRVPVVLDASKLVQSFKERCSTVRRLELLRLCGGKAECEAAASKSLEWLKACQNSDGSWGSRDQPAMTGLALLCYLGRCETPASPFYGDNVTRALVFLVEVSKKHQSGALTTKSDGREARWENAIATCALGEMCVLLQYDSQIQTPPGIKDAFARGVEAILASRPLERADGSYFVAGWAAEALYLARQTALNVSGLDEGIRQWVSLASSRQGVDGKFDRVLSLVESVMILQLLAPDQLGAIRNGIAALQQETALSEWDGSRAQGSRARYFECNALFRAGGSAWADFNAKMTDNLLAAQTGGAFAQSSDSSAQIETQCLFTLMLEAYYRLDHHKADFKP